ncbi:MAG: sulfotransferase family protein [Mycobacterium sp.]|nr:MAG: sulfotransferase family protein [Mycobacterium sp.]
MHGGVLVTPTSQSGAPARPVVLFVLGSGRSGTSALTRVLSLCGGTLPPGMLGANSGNPHGFWEPRKAIVLNERILRRLGSAWEDPTLRLYEEGAFDAEARTACITKVRAYLSTLPAAPLVVIKEPKITLLSGVWFEAARLAGFHVVAVIAMRHPQEAIASLRKMGTSFELSSALWLKANLLAERHTRGTPRVFVEYTNLLNDWRREVFRISAGLAIDLHTRDEGAIEEFLNLDLRRQRRRGPVTDPFGTDWISTVYETLHAASQDEPWDASALDRAFEEYRASEHTFRTALEEFRRIRRLNVGMRPSILKLIYEVSAIAHRRSGTWA